MTQIIPNNALADFLNTIIIQNQFVFINYWSFVHIFSGMVIGYFIEDWKVVLGLLILYEVFEFLLYGRLFQPERVIDIVWDIGLGMLGFFIIRMIQ